MSTNYAMPPHNKVAVVTGGGSGIGRAICLRLAADQIAVAVWDLNKRGAEETVALIKQSGGKAIACTLDASNTEQIALAAATTVEFLGPINIMVNNAAITGFVKIMDISEEMWDRMMHINLKGPFLCIQAVLPGMIQSCWGRIVNISSSSAQQGSSRMSHYAASKGGIIGFTKSLAIELATSGITVNNVPPGFVDTPMLRAAPVDIDELAQERPMQRAGRPEDIAAACAYLISDDAGYVTGQTLSVNGGAYLN